MSTHPPFRKVFAGVATRSQMFTLFNRHRDTPGVNPPSGKAYASEWFEIEASSYHFMLGLLPPLFQRTGMFGMSEYKAGNVTSVFCAVRIRGRERWFHGFCDLSDKRATAAGGQPKLGGALHLHCRPWSSGQVPIPAHTPRLPGRRRSRAARRHGLDFLRHRGCRG